MIMKVIDTGLENHVVCDRIYQHYRRECSLTQLIKAVRDDKRRGYIPPLLRIGIFRGNTRVSVNNDTTNDGSVAHV